jgi:hypothetical protein
MNGASGISAGNNCLEVSVFTKSLQTPPLSKGGIGKGFGDESQTHPVNLPTENPEGP